MRMLVAAAALLSLHVGRFALAIEDEKARLESVQGGSQVMIIRPAGERMEIAPGDRVRTGPDDSVRISYPDGSQAVVGRSSEYTVRAPEGGAQIGELQAGHLRMVVVKPKGAAPKGTRFIIRTKAATMGVRGTDFTVDVGSRGEFTAVHVLGGTVEVARGASAGVEGKGAMVRPNQTVRVEAGEVSPVKSFDRGSFLASLRDAQPGEDKLLRGISGIVAEAQRGPDEPTQAPAPGTKPQDAGPPDAPKLVKPREVAPSSH